MPHLTPEHVLANVDWQLLDQQRTTLGELRCSGRILFNPNAPIEAEHVEGILAFLDALTDAAHSCGRFTRP